MIIRHLSSVLIQANEVPRHYCTLLINNKKKSIAIAFNFTQYHETLGNLSGPFLNIVIHCVRLV